MENEEIKDTASDTTAETKDNHNIMSMRAEDAVASLDAKLAAFKNAFDEMNKAMLANFMASAPPQAEDMTHKPEKLSPIEATKHMLKSKKFMILSGAGLSAASGIPTFRGNNGFWKRSYEGVSNPMDLLTNSNFKKHPKAVWDWHFDFIELAKKCKPNAGHGAIMKFMEY